MVQKNICPNCGSEMEVGNLFVSGHADCKTCGYKGLPLAESDYVKKMRKQAEVDKPESDILDMHNLSGKLAIVFAGILVMSLLMPVLRPLAPVAFLGLILFALSYKFLEKK
jgi:hypothetical protein